MKHASLILAVVCSSISAHAQYRMVSGGAVYSIYDPMVWVTFGNLEVESINQTRLVCQCFVVNETQSLSVNQGALVGHGHLSSSFSRSYGETIVLLNYPGARGLVPGNVIGPVQAVLVDRTSLTHGPTSTTTFNGTSGNDVIQHYDDLQRGSVYDMGIPYTPPAVQLTREQKAAQDKKQHRLSVKTFHWIESQATNGSVPFQTSLGEHYLAGNGTETNLVLGKFWLQKAADAGDIEASNKLVSLSQTNVVAADDEK